MSGPGRPSKYSQELADKICDLISVSNKGLHHICRPDDMPNVTTVMRWLSDAREEYDYFRKQYARARELQADLIFEEITDVIEHTAEDHTPFTGGNVVQRDRLKVDAKKWQASKLAPKKYGDKLDLTTQGEKITPVITGMIIEPPKEKEGE